MTELKDKIIALCNNSGLTLEAVMFVLKDLYRDAEDSFLAYQIKKQQKQEEEAKKDEENEEV